MQPHPSPQRRVHKASSYIRIFSLRVLPALRSALQRLASATLSVFNDYIALNALSRYSRCRFRGGSLSDHWFALGLSYWFDSLSALSRAMLPAILRTGLRRALALRSGLCDRLAPHLCDIGIRETCGPLRSSRPTVLPAVLRPRRRSPLTLRPLLRNRCASKRLDCRQNNHHQHDYRFLHVSTPFIIHT